MTNHEELFEEFSQESRKLEDGLNGVLKTLVEGKAPSEEESENLAGCMTKLRNIYSDIQTEARSLNADIADDQSIFTYKELFNEYETIKLVSQVESLIVILKRFTGVVSENEEYQAALLPYQIEATKTLEILNSDETSLNSKLEFSCSDQEAFLNAISMKNDLLLGDEGEALLDSLDEIYSRKVVRGIIRGQYKELSNNDLDLSETQDKDIKSIKISVLPSSENEESSRNHSANQPPYETNNKNNQIADIERNTEETAENKSTIKQMPGEANKLNVASEQMAEDRNPHNTGSEIDTSKTIRSLGNVKKPSNVSARSFTKEISSMPILVCDILPHMSKFGAMNEEQLISATSMLYEDWEDSHQDDAKRAIDTLVKKGLLSSFNTEDFGISYTLTSYGKSLLEKESIKSLRHPKKNKPYWHAPIRNHPLKADETVEEKVLLDALSQTGALIRYLKVVHSTQTPECLLEVYSKTEYLDKRFVTQVHWGYSDFECQVYDSTENDFLEANVLFVCKEGEQLGLEDSKFENAFLTNGTNLMKWEGSWTTYIADSRSAPNTDTEDKLAKEMLLTNEDVDNNAIERHRRIGKTSIDTRVADFENTPVKKMEHDTPTANAITSSSESALSEQDLYARIKHLAEQNNIPSDEEFTKIAKELLSETTKLADPEDEFSNLAGAITLLAAASTINGYTQTKLMFNQLILATGLKIGQVESTGRDIAASFPEYSNDNEILRFSAYCLALFAPHMAYDYNLNNAVDMFLGNFEDFFPSLVAFKPLLNELKGISGISPEEGFSDNILDMMGSQAKRSKRLSEIREKATELRNLPKIKAKLHGIPQFLNACFGKDSDMYLCMQIIEEDKRDEAELVQDIYSSYCLQDEKLKQIDESIINRKIDDEWHAAVEGKSTSRLRKLSSEPRKKAQDAFYERLKLMKKWLSYDEEKVDADVLLQLKKKKASLLEIINELHIAGALPKTDQNAVVIKLMLRTLEDKLNSNDNKPLVFTSLLKTGIISLDGEMYPIIDGTLNKVPYYEPWRNALRHLSTPVKTFEEVRTHIFDDDSSELFDNLRQLSIINNLMSDDADNYKVTQSHLEQAEETAEAETNKFQDSLEIAYTYGQINEIQKEDLSASVSAYKEPFFARKDYGCWRQLLSALERQVDTLSAPQEKVLRTRLEELKCEIKHGSVSTLLNEAERLLNEERNFTVVEDYLNRFEAGQVELTDELNAKLHDPDLFSNFISDEVFKPLYETCYKQKGTPLPSFGKNFLKNRYPQDWTTRQRESSEGLINSWPVSPKRFKGETLAKLMKSIGFKVRGVPELVKKEKRELYLVNVRPEVADRTDYRHPISSFGTQIKSPMNVLILYGNHTPQEIIDIVAAESIVGTAIVFINYPINLPARRQMAEIFHTQKSRLTSFLLIDQVLALHLALHQETERMPLMLKCTLPFTYYQPFVRDSGPTADEMFCGRKHELQTIIDPNGASIVYGGRQLGKTALLERARSLRMKPDIGEYAIYVSILNCNEEESVAQAISDAMQRAKLEFPTCSSLREVCEGIRINMQNEMASRVLLLIDESDKFLASISKNSYSALQPMVDLKRETKNNFKFVLAGLHNVSRMKNATSRNGIFGQLGEPLCIKPLTPNEALQLISRPLTYLGFQVDRYPHLETILTSTNYYPGILQFFGYTLVETMTKQYGDYYRAADGNPPYTLHKEQLGAIMNRSDLNNSIKEKFRWSLELDPRYFMIARCIALMCYDNNDQSSVIDIQKGFPADEIKKWADDLGILCLENETPQTYVNLLDEMVDMGILVRPIQEVARYRLRRRSFLNIIGSDLDTVLEDIDSNNSLEE